MHICVSICYQMFLMVYNQRLYPVNWIINPERVGRREKGRVGEEESELAWLHVPHLGKLAEPMTVIHLGTGFRR